jgi:hypothetical protein
VSQPKNSQLFKSFFSPVRAESEAPYRVVARGEGCPTCQHGDQFDIVGPDDSAQSQSWGDAEEVEYICELLNLAYAQGRADFAKHILRIAEGKPPMKTKRSQKHRSKPKLQRRRQTMTSRSNSTALATTAPPVIKWQDRTMPQDKVDLLKRTVARGTTDDQLALFLHICQRHGLDPFAKQVYCVLFNNSNNPPGVKDMVIITGIDGYRKMAARDHKDFAGSKSAVFTWFDPDKRTPRANARIPESATVTVKRKGGIENRWHGVVGRGCAR